jgi:hypothetical protein
VYGRDRWQRHRREARREASEEAGPAIGPFPRFDLVSVPGRVDQLWPDQERRLLELDHAA